jgi:hypothetical protein
VITIFSEAFIEDVLLSAAEICLAKLHVSLELPNVEAIIAAT